MTEPTTAAAGTIAGFFAGVGGVELGFQQAGFNPLYANEWDKYATVTYQANHSHPLQHADITQLNPAVDVPKTTIIAGGFPCQAFSIAGHRKGFEDEKGRGNLFFTLSEIVEEHRPEVVFLENVKHLLTHDPDPEDKKAPYGRTFSLILQRLHDLGYHTTWKVLNAKDYGNIPQGRERVYILGFKNQDAAEKFTWPEPVELTAPLSDFIDFHTKMDDRYYYTEEKFPYMFPTIADGVTSQDTVYQWRRVYVRANQSGVSPTLTSNMGSGGHNSPIILSDHGIRKLTPKECFNLMGFPKDFILPENLSHAQLYKQAGNSVVVPVINRIAEQVKTALADETEEQ